MKGGREEVGKVMSPLFPRLHVNDADKGGPRAPPRNKMALYEQFTIPSQRFDNKSVPYLPLPLHSISKVSTTSACGQDGAMFSSYNLPRQLPAYMNEEAQTHSFNTKDTNNSMRSGMEKSSLKSGVHRSLKSLKSQEYSQSSMDHSSSPMQDSKNSSRKRVSDEDDFRVPTFIHSKAPPSSDKDCLLIGKSSHRKTSEKDAGDTCITSGQLPNNSEKPPEELVAIYVSRKHERGYRQWKIKETLKLKEQLKMATLHEKSKGKMVEPFIPRASSDCENASLDVIELEKLTNGITKTYYESGSDCGTNCKIDSQKGSTNSEEAKKREPLRLQSKVQKSDANHPGNPEITEDRGNEDNWPASVDPGNATKAGESETSLLDSESGFDISPDDVVEMIGAKHFWKARRAILNQQRIFALQVFELHRLIKVQKLIAGSPHILLEGGSYITRSPTVPSKNRSEITAKSQLQFLNKNDDSEKTDNNEHIMETSKGPLSPLLSPEHGSKDDSQKIGSLSPLPSPEHGSTNDSRKIGPPSPFPSPQHGSKEDSQKAENNEGITEASKGPSSLPNMEHGLNRVSAVQATRNGLHSGNHSVVSTVSENNSPTPWYFPPSANQWLIPVMSPSEGLVYKPYMRPCPPAMGFMPPVWSGCGPVAMPPIVGDFISYGFPASNQQNIGTVPGAPVIAPNFYPAPCGFPFVNPLSSSADSVQMSAFVGMQQKEQTDEHSGSPGYLVKPGIEAFSSNSKRVQASRESELQGSTGSCLTERLHEAMDTSVSIRMHVPVVDSPSLGSQAPSSKQQARVIKVVPHNPRRATESAARIFNSIQRERQLYDSV